MGFKTISLVALGFAAYGARRFLKSIEPQKPNAIDPQFTGASPRGTGAFNVVIGGHPEDMNQMPSTGHMDSASGPVYDGSDLGSKSRAK